MINFISIQNLIYKVYAAEEEKSQGLGIIGSGQGFAPWMKNLENPGNIIAEIISKVLGVLTIVAGIWFLFQAIFAGYSYLSAGGDKTRIETAGKKLTNAILGLVIVIAAYGLIALLGTFLGVDFLDIAKFVKTITPTQ